MYISTYWGVSLAALVTPFCLETDVPSRCEEREDREEREERGTVGLKFVTEYTVAAE